MVCDERWELRHPAGLKASSGLFRRAVWRESVLHVRTISDNLDLNRCVPDVIGKEEGMSRFDQTTCIWPLLVFAAKNRQVLSYDLLGRLIGVPESDLGRLLEPIQSFCVIKELPPLTSIVVRARTGMPGEGFIAADNLPQAQAETFLFDWLNCPVPSREDYREAVNRLPSLGLSLSALMGQAGSKTPA